MLQNQGRTVLDFFTLAARVYNNVEYVFRYAPALAKSHRLDKKGFSNVHILVWYFLYLPSKYYS